MGTSVSPCNKDKQKWIHALGLTAADGRVLHSSISQLNLSRF
jgi:hypothetical protein